MGGAVLRFVIGEEHGGLTVLQILRGVIGLSGGMIRHIKFLDEGILLNGERVTVRRVVKAGDLLELDTSDASRNEKIKEYDLPLNIIYEDSDLVIPDKPPFMPTHPSHNHYDDTVANALAFRYRNMEEPFVFRPINRLDRNTSGALIIARNRIAAAELTRSMSEKKIRKRYIAVLDGALPDDEGVIETYMRRTAQSIIVREVCGREEGADYALTKYKVIARSDTNTLVSAQPVTGRTHQIRVHFSSLGCPLVGDELYGRGSDDIARHALHSYEIAFPHPSSKQTVSVKAPLHDDMNRLLRKLFSYKDIDNDF